MENTDYRLAFIEKNIERIKTDIFKLIEKMVLEMYQKILEPNCCSATEKEPAVIKRTERLREKSCVLEGLKRIRTELKKEIGNG